MVKKAPYPSVKPAHTDIHSAALINMELSALASHIDVVALHANGSMQYGDIMTYFASVNQYVSKIKPLISDTSKIDKIKKVWDMVSDAVESDLNCRTRKALRLMLQIIHDYYFAARDQVQQTQYYFRTTVRRKKGVGEVKLNDHDEDDLDD